MFSRWFGLGLLMDGGGERRLELGLGFIFITKQ